ncbi:hypothetical protein J6590_005996 [Homalodisca vitripennis]|nr:hypothetical protein J6590_005996 [Homalodisca vitripennis]
MPGLHPVTVLSEWESQTAQAYVSSTQPILSRFVSSSLTFRVTSQLIFIPRSSGRQKRLATPMREQASSFSFLPDRFLWPAIKDNLGPELSRAAGLQENSF